MQAPSLFECLVPNQAERRQRFTEFLSSWIAVAHAKCNVKIPRRMIFMVLSVIYGRGIELEMIQFNQTPCEDCGHGPQGACESNAYGGLHVLLNDLPDNVRSCIAMDDQFNLADMERCSKALLSALGGRVGEPAETTEPA